MDKQRGLLKKMLILEIFILFIGMSVVSSIGKTSEVYPSDNFIGFENFLNDPLFYDHFAFIIGHI